MSTWTAEMVGSEGATRPRLLHYRVTNPAGQLVAAISAPDTPEGKRDVARMVAALQMEGALKDAEAALSRVAGEWHSTSIADEWIAVRAALEAAKKLPEKAMSDFDRGYACASKQFDVLKEVADQQAQTACGLAFDLGRENEQLADMARTLGRENVRLHVENDRHAAQWSREAERRRAMRNDLASALRIIHEVFEEIDK